MADDIEHDHTVELSIAPTVSRFAPDDPRVSGEIAHLHGRCGEQLLAAGIGLLVVLILINIVILSGY
jgi:hypothetical protein